MKSILSVCVACVMFVSCTSAAMNIEDEICLALTNKSYLLSHEFTNSMNAVVASTNALMRCEAYMLLSINAYQNFLETANEEWLAREMSNASNSVNAIGMDTDTWQYWMSRFLYASAYASIDNYGTSLSIASNAVVEVMQFNYTNEVSKVEHAILSKYEMSDIGIVEALKVLTGMSAASLGYTGVATNYAIQVSAPYRSVIYEFLHDE